MKWASRTTIQPSPSAKDLQLPASPKLVPPRVSCAGNALAAWPSGLGKGLQSPVQRFDSARRLDGSV